MCVTWKKKERFSGIKVCKKKKKTKTSEIYFDNEIWNGKKNFSLFKQRDKKKMF